MHLIELDRLVLFEGFAEEMAGLRQGLLPPGDVPAAAIVVIYARAMASRGDRELARESAVRVKFCGITSRHDLRAAVRFFADAVGFILVPGTPRAIASSSDGSMR